VKYILYSKLIVTTAAILYWILFYNFLGLG